ncbi:MAG: hypothetical protein QM784_36550 [Polyangiaceae bacterium]
MTPRHWLLFGWVCIAVTSAGCRSHRCTEDDIDAPAVDSKLMAFLSRARAAHHEADLFDQDPEHALRPLQDLVSGPIPKFKDQPLAEAREVLADTQARIANLESQIGRYESAHQRLSDALELMPEPSYFRGHLFETRGLVYQRQAESLVRTGRVDAAKGAKQNAVEAFETAMEIQARVIHSTPKAPSTSPHSEPRNSRDSIPSAPSTSLGSAPSTPRDSTSGSQPQQGHPQQSTSRVNE